MPQSKPQGEPTRHHYIPEFYLKRWARLNGRLIRYKRGYEGVVSRPVTPKQIGFVEGLYETAGFPEQHRQETEKLFMSPVDNKAADALDGLLAGQLQNLSDELRCAWARFVMSIWFRTPADVKALHDIADTLGTSVGGQAVLGIQPPKELPEVARRKLAMHLLRGSIDDSSRGTALINMHWSVIRLETANELLVSDWPLDLPASGGWLWNPSSYIAMPLSPDHLFLASGARDVGEKVRRSQHRAVVAMQNSATVGHAETFVGASDESSALFIGRNFGCVPRPSLLSPIAQKYRDLASGV